MKCKYKVRWFSSKGASLILLWTLLASIAGILYIHSCKRTIQDIVHNLPVSPFVLGLTLLAFLFAPLGGWLADAKFGNYKVFRIGIVLLFVSTAMNCFLLVLEAMVWENSNTIKWVNAAFCVVVFLAGSCLCVVTVLPLGLDQMPDASASSITSFIAWLVFIFFIAAILNNIVDFLFCTCLKVTQLMSYHLIVSLISTLCTSTILMSDLLFQPNWLIKEPKAPRSLRDIYQVLKFASKHKAPLNRSALTYWEEDIPSRIDLSKSKYGGPFTTEQVEDVKTVLRLLLISLPLSLAIMFLSLRPLGFLVPQKSFPGLSLCATLAVYLFTYNAAWCSIVGAVTYEFVIYPCIRNNLPSILKRIGAVSLIITLVSLICFTIELGNFLSHSDESLTTSIVHILHELTNGLLSPVLLTSVLEFLCAQSPYHTRGLLLSIVGVLSFVAGMVGWNLVYVVFRDKCIQSWCSLVSFAVKSLVCLVAFFLFCIVARWYKRRVRDEDYSPHRVVEEVYDRYLTAAAATHST